MVDSFLGRLFGGGNDRELLPSYEATLVSDDIEKQRAYDAAVQQQTRDKALIGLAAGLIQAGQPSTVPGSGSLMSILSKGMLGALGAGGSGGFAKSATEAAQLGTAFENRKKVVAEQQYRRMQTLEIQRKLLDAQRYDEYQAGKGKGGTPATPPPQPALSEQAIPGSFVPNDNAAGYAGGGPTGEDRRIAQQEEELFQQDALNEAARKRAARQAAASGDYGGGGVDPLEGYGGGGDDDDLEDDDEDTTSEGTTTPTMPSTAPGAEPVLRAGGALQPQAPTTAGSVEEARAFQSALDRAIAAANEAGIPIQKGSLYRGFAEQQRLSDQYGGVGVARPGTSMHGKGSPEVGGMANDLMLNGRPIDRATLMLIEPFLEAEGLHAPLKDWRVRKEPWHIEPIGARGRRAETDLQLSPDLSGSASPVTVASLLDRASQGTGEPSVTGVGTDVAPMISPTAIAQAQGGSPQAFSLLGQMAAGAPAEETQVAALQPTGPATVTDALTAPQETPQPGVVEPFSLLGQSAMGPRGVDETIVAQAKGGASTGGASTGGGPTPQPAPATPKPPTQPAPVAQSLTPETRAAVDRINSQIGEIEADINNLRRFATDPRARADILAQEARITALQKERSDLISAGPKQGEITRVQKAGESEEVYRNHPEHGEIFVKVPWTELAKPGNRERAIVDAIAGGNWRKIVNPESPEQKADAATLAHQRELAKLEQQHNNAIALKDREKADQIETGHYTKVQKQGEAASSSDDALASIERMNKLMDEGAHMGMGSEWKLELDKFMMMMFGTTDTRKLANTENLRGDLTKRLKEIQGVFGPPISNTDIAHMINATLASTRMDEHSIRKALNESEKFHRKLIDTYNFNAGWHSNFYDKNGARNIAFAIPQIQRREPIPIKQFRQDQYDQLFGDIMSGRSKLSTLDKMDDYKFDTSTLREALRTRMIPQQRTR